MFPKFMASGAGRILRIVAGIALVAAGLMMMDGAAGYVIAAVGLVPLIAGVIDICVFAPLFGMSIKGQEIRDS